MAIEQIGVAVAGPPGVGHRLANHLNRYQRRYRLECMDEIGLWCRDFVPRATIRLRNDFHRFFHVCRESGILLSAFDSAPISRYLGVREEEYLAMGALLGLAQWRVLDVNPLINPEDWLHEPGGTCLYSPCESVQEYTLLLEHAGVCGSCRDFYCCLGAETELCLVQELAERFGRSFA